MEILIAPAEENDFAPRSIIDQLQMVTCCWALGIFLSPGLALPLPGFAHTGVGCPGISAIHHEHISLLIIRRAAQQKHLRSALCDAPPAFAVPAPDDIWAALPHRTWDAADQQNFLQLRVIHH